MKTESKKYRVRFNYDALKSRIKQKYGKFSNFSREIGMSYSTLSRLLNNRMQFTTGIIFTFCRTLDIPSDMISVFFFDESVTIKD